MSTTNHLRLLLLASLWLQLTLALHAASPSWIWYPEPPQPHSVRLFRLHCDLPAFRSAELLAIADDSAEISLNGQPAKPLVATLNLQRRDVTQHLHPGKNLLAVRARNGRGPAGLLLLIRLITDDGVIAIVSDASWRCSDQDTPDWASTALDDSAWPHATIIGPAFSSPWKNIRDLTPFTLADSLPPPPQTPPETHGRLLLDDFSDVSSWMANGRLTRGLAPGHIVFPGELGLSSIPAPERDDGFCGAFSFAFSHPDGGELHMHKNAVYQRFAMPQALELDANADGHQNLALIAVLRDATNRLFRTSELPIPPDKAWHRLRLPLTPDTIRNFRNIHFPVALATLAVRARHPVSGTIRIDDLCLITDMTDGKGSLTISPVYRGLATPPGQPLQPTYRLRNAWNRPLDLSLTLDVLDIHGRRIATRRQPLTLPAHQLALASFDAGIPPALGAYQLRLTAQSALATTTHHGWAASFTPNGKRLNTIPTWFGVEDQGLRNGLEEERLHLSWLKDLGADILRANLIGTQFEPRPNDPNGLARYLRLYRPHADAGLLLLLSYAGSVPSWAGTLLDRNFPDFDQHIEHLADLITQQPAIRYLEWFNEPNLAFFPGTTDNYLNALKRLYPILKRRCPTLKVATGGMAIGHPKGKRDMPQRTYQEASPFYDIACYHGHEDYRPHRQTTLNALDHWLSQAGIPDKPTGNSEAGCRSYYGQLDTARHQASELIRKITLTRARKADFYIWFMLQDYGDKYLNADDSFGLVTTDNQPKPSFVAYNELIRQLANTTPADASREPQTWLSPQLESLRFTNGQEDVIVCWPTSMPVTFTVTCRSTLRQFDLFGNLLRETSEPGLAILESTNLPTYLRCQANALSPSPALLQPEQPLVLLPDEAKDFAFTLTNPFPQAVTATLTWQGTPHTTRLAPNASIRISLPCHSPSDSADTNRRDHCAITMRTDDGKMLLNDSQTLPLNLATPLRLIQDATTLPPLTLDIDSPSSIREISFDPSTPKWQGPQDLSLKFGWQLTQDKLLLRAIVTDNHHSTPKRNAFCWQNDCIQIAIVNPSGQHFEFTLSDQPHDAPVVWCHISPKHNGDLTGRPWPDASLTITRHEGQTIYQAAIPCHRLNLTPNSGDCFRAAIHDNDQGHPRRQLLWHDGIQPAKNTALFGWLKIQ